MECVFAKKRIEFTLLVVINVSIHQNETIVGLSNNKKLNRTKVVCILKSNKNHFVEMYIYVASSRNP